MFNSSGFFPHHFSYFSVCRVLCMFSLKLGGCRSPQSLYSFNWPFSQFMVTWDSCKWDFSRVGSHNLCDRIETSAQLGLACHDTVVSSGACYLLTNHTQRIKTWGRENACMCGGYTTVYWDLYFIKKRRLSI